MLYIITFKKKAIRWVWYVEQSWKDFTSCMTAVENTLLVLETLTPGCRDTCDMLVYFMTEI